MLASATAATPDRLRLVRGAHPTATHLSHAARLLIEVFGSNDGLSAHLVKSLDSAALFLSVLLSDLLDGALTGQGKAGLLLCQLVQAVAIFAHLVIVGERLLVLHLECLVLAL